MAIAIMVVISIGVLALCLYSLGLTWFLGVVLPYAAVLVFLSGCSYRIVNWARSPVPFPIGLTGGQQKSLPWIKQSKLEAPTNPLEVLGRMMLEVFLFRSLFRNTRAQMRQTRDGPRLVYWSSKWL